MRLIAYVEDRRNCLIFEPSAKLSVRAMASLQADLKPAIQPIYELEDGELAAEPLPGTNDRRSILLYEWAEGGAGILRRLGDDFRPSGESPTWPCRFATSIPIPAKTAPRADGQGALRGGLLRVPVEVHESA